jgi:hypothetical protein
MERKGSLLSGGRGIAICVILLALAGFLTYRTLTTAGRPVPQPVETIFMCSETRATFPYAMHEGERWPVLSPFTNKKTGYPAEHCYWTRDGKRKAMPTYVILNENLGKPGDTICPDCGRVVIGHNPLPPTGTPLAAPGPAMQQSSAPSVGKQAVPPGKAPMAPAASQPAPTPVGASPGATPPSPQDAVAAERVLFATIRAKMDEMIQERARLLKSGKDRSAVEVQQLEASILKARQLLTDKGEVVGEIVPPITQTAEPGK